jgi:Flp pilus assembly protein TadD
MLRPFCDSRNVPSRDVSMPLPQLRFAMVWCLAAALFSIPARAGDLRIPIPTRSKPTPVQQLNREGVKAVEKRQYDKAKKLFYRAYLLDPDDPFTLNNLGYISELQGDVDRAQRYYNIAAQYPSTAQVAKSNLRTLEGQPFSEAVHGMKDTHLQANRANVEAIRLLSHGRPQEAEALLKQALAANPQDPFTLNNLGFTKENEGELQAAHDYYQSAARLHSNEPIIVALNQKWRGQPISKVAATNAKNVQRQMHKRENSDEKVAHLNLRGVSAFNRNDQQAARRYIEQAYKLNPSDAFTLNNMGYLAELDGDRETADDYYARARQAQQATARVTFATRHDVEGLRVGTVAQQNDTKVQARLEAQAEAKRRQGGPIQLKLRNGAAVREPEVPQAPPGSEQSPVTQPPTQNVQPPPQPVQRPESPYSPPPPKLPKPELPGTEPTAQPQQGQQPPATPAPEMPGPPRSTLPTQQTNPPQTAPPQSSAPGIIPQGQPPLTQPPQATQSPQQANPPQ